MMTLDEVEKLFEERKEKMTEEEKKDLFEVQEEYQIELFNSNNELAHNTSWLLSHYIKKVKEIEQKQDELYQRIKEQMEVRKIKKFENDFIAITYIEPTTRQSFDSKSLKADNPELYAQYVNESDVKASVRIKAK
jgi:hypothetical protein